ncbi:hypothetical protein HPG69_018378 [Diceros bicornis minor]|uniref:Uncharacterized protein n=1 Tax=Diceros bicornis minor TaxID=77932 RepID=A0A7J7FEJ7_DICBM|nr:hypothetical protein HPG69_018378 [Diceros bicornis minor]
MAKASLLPPQSLDYPHQVALGAALSPASSTQKKEEGGSGWGVSPVEPLFVENDSSSSGLEDANINVSPAPFQHWGTWGWAGGGCAPLLQGRDSAASSLETPSLGKWKWGLGPQGPACAEAAGPGPPHQPPQHQGSGLRGGSHQQQPPRPPVSRTPGKRVEVSCPQSCSRTKLRNATTTGSGSSGLDTLPSLAVKLDLALEDPGRRCLCEQAALAPVAACSRGPRGSSGGRRWRVRRPRRHLGGLASRLFPHGWGHPGQPEFEVTTHAAHPDGAYHTGMRLTAACPTEQGWRDRRDTHHVGCMLDEDLVAKSDLPDHLSRDVCAQARLLRDELLQTLVREDVFGAHVDSPWEAKRQHAHQERGLWPPHNPRQTLPLVSDTAPQRFFPSDPRREAGQRWSPTAATLPTVRHPVEFQTQRRFKTGQEPPSLNLCQWSAPDRQQHLNLPRHIPDHSGGKCCLESTPNTAEPLARRPTSSSRPPGATMFSTFWEKGRSGRKVQNPPSLHLRRPLSPSACLQVLLGELQPILLALLPGSDGSLWNLTGHPGAPPLRASGPLAPSSLSPCPRAMFHRGGRCSWEHKPQTPSGVPVPCRGHEESLRGDATVTKRSNPGSCGDGEGGETLQASGQGGVLHVAGPHEAGVEGGASAQWGCRTVPAVSWHEGRRHRRGTFSGVQRWEGKGGGVRPQAALRTCPCCAVTFLPPSQKAPTMCQAHTEYRRGPGPGPSMNTGANG